MGREPRVTFFGDSVSWVIGTYLPPHPGMRTTVRAIEGCGIATLPRHPAARRAAHQLSGLHVVAERAGSSAWPRTTPTWRSIELNRWELMDRIYQGRYQHVGDPEYDAYLLAQLDTAVSIAGSQGAAVVLLTAAYTHRAERPDGSLYPEDEPDRVDAWNRLLCTEAARRPGDVTVLDLNPVVCPQGAFTWRINGIRVRSDGLHYTPAGVQRFIAPWLLPRLAQIATGTYGTVTPSPTSR